MYRRVCYVKYFIASHSFVFYQIISNFLLSRTIFNTAYWSHYLPADCNPAVSTGTWPSTKRNVQRETLSHAGTADVEDLRCEMDAETDNVVKVIFPDGLPGKC